MHIRVDDAITRILRLTASDNDRGGDHNLQTMLLGDFSHLGESLIAPLDVIHFH